MTGDESLPQLPLHQVDLDAVRICRLLGQHHGEGQVIDGRCVGRCAVCGAGMLTDGS